MEENSEKAGRTATERQIIAKAKELMQKDTELDTKTAILKAIRELNLLPEIFEICMLFDLSSVEFVEQLKKEMERTKGEKL